MPLHQHGEELSGTHEARRLDEVALGRWRRRVLRPWFATRRVRRAKSTRRLLQRHQAHHALGHAGSDRGGREPNRSGGATAASGQRRGEPHLRDAEDLREQRRVTAQPHRIQREPVDVVDRQARVFDRREHRLARQLERCLGNGTTTLVVGRRTHTDNGGLVTECHLAHERGIMARATERAEWMERTSVSGSNAAEATSSR